MPHKRNPVLSENISGLARLVRSYATASLENIPLWHERDISHSSVERVIAPDATILIDFMLTRMTTLIKKLTVYPENMLKNLNQLKGLPFSQRVLLGLIQKGISREKAYLIVQRCAMKTWESEIEFKDALKKDKELMGNLTEKDLDRFFDVGYYNKHVDLVFKRVFK